MCKFCRDERHVLHPDMKILVEQMAYLIALQRMEIGEFRSALGMPSTDPLSFLKASPTANTVYTAWTSQSPCVVRGLTVSETGGNGLISVYKLDPKQPGGQEAILDVALATAIPFTAPDGWRVRLDQGVSLGISTNGVGINNLTMNWIAEPVDMTNDEYFRARNT